MPGDNAMIQVFIFLIGLGVYSVTGAGVGMVFIRQGSPLIGLGWAGPGNTSVAGTRWGRPRGGTLTGTRWGTPRGVVPTLTGTRWGRPWGVHCWDSVGQAPGCSPYIDGDSVGQAPR